MDLEFLSTKLNKTLSINLGVYVRDLDDESKVHMEITIKFVNLHSGLIFNHKTIQGQLNTNVGNKLQPELNIKRTKSKESRTELTEFLDQKSKISTLV